MHQFDSSFAGRNITSIPGVRWSIPTQYNCTLSPVSKSLLV
jgi:hypothetical protein